MKFVLLVALVGIVAGQNPGGNTAPTFIAPTPLSQGSASSKYPVCIGGEVKFDILAEDTQNVQAGLNIVTITVTKAPATAIVSGQTYPDPDNKSVVKRSVLYLPKHDINKPEVDEQICFTAGDNNNGEGTGSMQNTERCVNIVKRYFPKFIPKTPEADHTILTFIDRSVEFTIMAEDQNELDSVSIMVDEDPGLPNGAVVEKQVCPNEESVESGDSTGVVPCNPTKRVFKWTPSIGQEGPVPGGIRSYRVCFHIRDNKDSCSLGGYFNPEQRCVNINVQAPNEEWIGLTPNDNDLFEAHVSRTMPGGGRPTEHHNCEICYEMEAHSAEGKYYSEIFNWWTTVEPAAPATSSETYPYKPAADASFAGGRSNSYNNDKDNHLVWSDANGMTLPQGATVDEIPQAEAGEGEDPKTSFKMKFCWKPVRGQEARVYKTCYESRDTYHIDGPDRTRRCVRIEVVRCKYCTQPGETLLNIAVDYNTDWLQLWGANVDVKNPDHLYDFQLLNIGPVYHVREGDSLDALAARFHTTPDEILSVNPDVAAIHGDGSDHDLSVGQALCIMPGICTFTEYHLQRD